MSKQYDVVVFGGTGFTGKLCCRYLETHAGKPSWAIAGRSRTKLESVVKELGLKSNPGLIEAETGNPDSLRTMARQTKSLVNIVGPFRKFRADLVIEACIAEKTHYVDLSGETNFNEEIIQQFHEKAQKANVVIGCSVGLDSLPSDVSTYLAVQHLKNKQGCPGADTVHMALGQIMPPSSGTIQSAIDMAESDPSSLLFQDAGRLSTHKPNNDMRFTCAVWVPQFNAYGLSNLITPHNVRIVYRSWGLLEDVDGPDKYGKNFEYDDLLVGGSWYTSQAMATVNKVGSFFLANFSPVRSFLSWALPQNGGPSEKVQNSINTDVRTLATYGQKKALCTMFCKGDPGYSITARMIVETALTCALDHDKLHPLGKKGGALTPATIGADAIAERFVKYAGFDISTKDF